jgi:hypothetical protein
MCPPRHPQLEDSGEMRRFKSHIILLFTCLLTLLGSVNLKAADRIIESGSFIINMGVIPQTYNNGLKPYGLIYDLVYNYNIPLTWCINPLKTKDGVDFSHNGVDYRGGPFIIRAEYINPTIAGVIANWQAQGVVGAYMVANDTVPVYGEITFWPLATLDTDNGNIAQAFYDNAGIPGTAYNYDDPDLIDQCDDIFIMPHADPTWATHSNLKTWNATYNGYIWASCHAVSVLESLRNPGNPNDRMNFLTEDGLQCYHAGECDTISEVHAGAATTPYKFDSAYSTSPLLQVIGSIGSATENGSERWYIPTSYGRWRSTTNRAFLTSDGAPPREGVLFAFGRAFGNPNNGFVFYLAGHDQDKGTADAVAAQRAFFNFIMTSAVEKGMNIEASFPAALGPGVSKPVSARVVAGGNGPYTYTWSTSCPNSYFLNPNDSATIFYPDSTIADTTSCILTVTVTDQCGRQVSESKALLLLPVDTFCNNVFRDTFSIANVPEADSFIWTWSPGLSLVGGDPSDTMVILSWFGSPAGFYDVCVQGVNDCGISDISCTSFYVEVCNRPDTAVTDSLVVDEDNSLTADIIANDIDPDFNIDTSSIYILIPPVNGVASVDTNTGILSYTPNANFNGPDSLAYVLCDLGDPIFCDTGWVYITVNPINDQPLAVNDTAVTNEDNAVDIDVSANDSDPIDPAGNIDPTTVAVISGPNNGSTSVNPVTGIVTYTPSSM